MTNELLEEVREARAALAAEHGYDHQRIYEWAKAAHAARQQALRHEAPHSADEVTENGGHFAGSK